MAATLLFIIETLYKAYQLYHTANTGRSLPGEAVTSSRHIQHLLENG